MCVHRWKPPKESRRPKEIASSPYHPTIAPASELHYGLLISNAASLKPFKQSASAPSGNVITTASPTDVRRAIDANHNSSGAHEHIVPAMSHTEPTCFTATVTGRTR